MRFLRTGLVLALGLVLGASAVAMAVDPPQQYTGCLTRDGTLYKVAPGTSPVKACAKSETPITWNQQGPQGVAGAKGADGAAGANGTNGAAGAAGAAGAPGVALTAIRLDGGSSTNWKDLGAFDLHVACYGTPYLAWEASGRPVNYYKEVATAAGVATSFAAKANDDHVYLGAGTLRATYVIWDPASSVPPQEVSLWGTDCSNMVYSESPATGTAAPAANMLSVTVTGGTLSVIDIRFPASDGGACNNSATCSWTSADADYGLALLSHPSAFTYRCDAGDVQQATAEASRWTGQCSWSPFEADHTVTVHLPS